MKLIESSYKILSQEPGLDGIYKMCEIAGRTAYKSEDRITEGSAKRFVESLMKLNHGAVLEHGTVYLKVSHTSPVADRDYMEKMNVIHFYVKNKYSKYKRVTEDHFHIDNYITTNLRVLFENNRLDDLQYLCEPTEHHEKRVTVKFICSRSIAQEITRHRVFSFLMESQRYVAYNKDKFGGEITYIIPDWVKLRMNDLSEDDFNNCENNQVIMWRASLAIAEANYMTLIDEGLKAEEARSVLPNDCKTELVMTGFISDWEHFFDLRALDKTGKAHPDIKALACPLRAEFILNGYVNS